MRTDRSSHAGARPSARALLDRRDYSSRLALLRRVALEYDEMPALRLTAAQARRLFALREDICLRVFAALVERDLLAQDGGGAFVRAHPEPGWPDAPRR